ncbi:MAG: hypothetical protein HY393_04095 [Candidatus Diapherotrites archaeon]|nr:hypothetical protein [Candidatus Diapherotrites archaeon]
MKEKNTGPKTKVSYRVFRRPFSQKGRMKKGFIFTLDAFFALTLITLAGIWMAFQFNPVQDIQTLRAWDVNAHDASLIRMYTGQDVSQSTPSQPPWACEYHYTYNTSNNLFIGGNLTLQGPDTPSTWKAIQTCAGGSP